VGSEFNKEATWALPCSHPVPTPLYLRATLQAARVGVVVWETTEKKPTPVLGFEPGTFRAQSGALSAWPQRSL
jgi:hypothetical protein